MFLLCYFWLRWDFAAVHGFLRLRWVRAALPCRVRFLVVLACLVPSVGPRHTGSVVVADGLSCSSACGIFPAQGSNLCPLRWQADSYQPGDGLCVLSPRLLLPICTLALQLCSPKCPIPSVFSFKWVALAVLCLGLQVSSRAGQEPVASPRGL